jgi:hypothetical protein
VNRRFFSKLIAFTPFCLSGWDLSEVKESKPAPVCKSCGEIGHEHKIVQIRPVNPDYFWAPSYQVAMICKNRTINPAVYEIL